jgi:hypothetical protein
VIIMDSGGAQRCLCTRIGGKCALPLAAPFQRLLSRGSFLRCECKREKRVTFPPQRDGEVQQQWMIVDEKGFRYERTDLGSGVTVEGSPRRSCGLVTAMGSGSE